MRTMFMGVVAASVLLWAGAGCKRGQKMKPVSQPPTPSVQQPAQPASRAAPATQPATGGRTLTGKVLETKDTKSYTYLKLATAQGEKWAAVMKAPVKVGDRVVVHNPLVMHNFKSKTLGRTWKEIVFGTLAGTPAGRGAAMKPGAKGMSPHGKMLRGAKGMSPHGKRLGAKGMAAHGKMLRGTKAKLDIQVPKAKGPRARTVAEIYAQRARLKNKKVTVRGKVTKYNGGIMGKNWVHLQDGSGSAKARDYDLTVTTQVKVRVGDIVVASGVVRVDKNVGAGYSYPVLLESATLKK